MKNIARRIAKLEALMSGPPPEYRRGWRWRSRGLVHSPISFIYGNLTRLPEDYKGERHVEIARRLPPQNGEEWVEFVEVPGPQPYRPPGDLRFGTVVHVIFVEPYPARS